MYTYQRKKKKKLKKDTQESVIFKFKKKCVGSSIKRKKKLVSQISGFENNNTY